jgi:hypothetical protein
VIRNLGILAAAAVAFWASLVGLAYLTWDRLFADSGLSYETVLGFSITALLLCLVPACLTMLWLGWGPSKTPEQQVATILGGTGVRMFVVLGVCLLLTETVPYYQRPGFLIWVLLFYLFTLALEIVLLLRGRRTAGASK